MKTTSWAATMHDSIEDFPKVFGFVMLLLLLLNLRIPDVVHHKGAEYIFQALGMVFLLFGLLVLLGLGFCAHLATLRLLMFVVMLLLLLDVVNHILHSLHLSHHIT